ncbi:MAG: outer membrane beta-barrel protein [Treponemataceae bacterium]
MKKLTAFVASLIVSLYSFTYAADFSFGTVIGGFGTTSVRGSDYKSFLEDNAYDSFVGIPYSMSFSPMVDIRGQVDIIKYLGFEFGVGYAQRSIGFYQKPKVGEEDDHYISKYTLPSISIPLMLKAQFPINKFILFYAGVGTRLNFNVKVNLDVYKNDKKENKKYFAQRYDAVDLDLSIALGSEYIIGKNHYLGLRLGYDFNMLGSLLNEDFEKQKIYIDNLAISLTYRYMISDKNANKDASFVYQR